MSYIRLWGELEDLYRSTSRVHMLREFGHVKMVWLVLGTFFTVAVSSLIFFVVETDRMLYGVLLTVIVGLVLMAIFVHTLAGKEPEQLAKHPYLSRERYLRYMMFRDRFQKHSELKNVDINALLEWEEVRYHKFDMANFFMNPLALLIYSAVISQWLGIYATVKEEEWLSAAMYLVIIGLFVAWLMRDAWTSDKRRNFEICRMLRWMQIERTGHASSLHMSGD